MEDGGVTLLKERLEKFFHRVSILNFILFVIFIVFKQIFREIQIQVGCSSLVECLPGMCRAWLPSPALGGGRRGRNDEEKHRYKQVCFLSPKPQNLKVAKSLGGTMAKSEQQGTPWANTLAILSVSLSLFFFFFCGSWI
jgi:hypothetical protein